MGNLLIATAMILATATVAVAPSAAEEIVPPPATPTPIFSPRATPIFSPRPLAAAPLLLDCEEYRITGYVRTAPYHNAHTYDGTPILTKEPIVAASWNLPIDTIVRVSGLGRFRVADRGRLGTRHIDVAVWSEAEAYALTGQREVCRVA